MYLCYVDESGSAGTSSDNSHFVLAGLSIPIWRWRDADLSVSRILGTYGLDNAELHTAWMMRKYLEQSKIPRFKELSWTDRRRAVHRYRSEELSRLSGASNDTRRKRIRKLHRNTESYIHLTWEERREAVLGVAKVIRNWGFARLFC